MTSKFSRAALIAGLAIGASGLVAVPAEAANGISTANYYVNGPAVSGASNITPESAVVSGAIDTGGSSETQLPIPSTGLTWNATITIADHGRSREVERQHGSEPHDDGNYAPVDGLPVSGSSSNVSVTDHRHAVSTRRMSGLGAISGIPQAVSNGGADNYSDVTFEYDPVSDYDRQRRPARAVDASRRRTSRCRPRRGLSSVKTTIGAFGQAAQNNTGNTR